MRALILVGLLLILSTIEIASTWYLLNNTNGLEINPFVNIDSLWGIILSPIPNLVDLTFLLCVYLSEKNAHRFDEFMAGGIFKAGIFLFPLYYLFQLSIVASSNTIAVLGHSTPLSMPIRLFSFVSDNMFIQLGMFLSVTLLLTLPLFVRLARHLYSTHASQGTQPQS